MPRIRTIKPDFFMSEDIVTLDPLSRLLYIGLWCYVDRDGYMEYRPFSLKIQIMPCEQDQFDACIDALLNRNLVKIYEIDAKKYLFIPTFTEHQNINQREASSNIKNIVVKSIDCEVTCRNMHARAIMCKTIPTSARIAGKERKGRERKGKEYNNNKKTKAKKENNNFEMFWLEYPKKIAKKKALDIFCRINPNHELADKIIFAIKQQKQQEQDLIKHGQFAASFPHPTTWLNQERWNDEVMTISQISRNANKNPKQSALERVVDNIADQNNKNQHDEFMQITGENHE